MAEDIQNSDLDNVRARMEKLADEIEKHNHAYYVLDQPTISDELYDSLFQELQHLEEQYPELKSPASPTQRVGGAVKEELQKSPMPGLCSQFAQKRITRPKGP